MLGRCWLKYEDVFFILYLKCKKSFLNLSSLTFFISLVRLPLLGWLGRGLAVAVMLFRLLLMLLMFWLFYSGLGFPNKLMFRPLRASFDSTFMLFLSRMLLYLVILLPLWFGNLDNPLLSSGPSNLFVDLTRWCMLPCAGVPTTEMSLQLDMLEVFNRSLDLLLFRLELLSNRLLSPIEILFSLLELRFIDWSYFSWILVLSIWPRDLMKVFRLSMLSRVILYSYAS